MQGKFDENSPIELIRAARTLMINGTNFRLPGVGDPDAAIRNDTSQGIPCISVGSKMWLRKARRRMSVTELLRAQVGLSGTNVNHRVQDQQMLADQISGFAIAAMVVASVVEEGANMGMQARAVPCTSCRAMLMRMFILYPCPCFYRALPCHVQ